jgi:DNA-binding GntR family transcriptional regulator
LSSFSFQNVKKMLCFDSGVREAMLQPIKLMPAREQVASIIRKAILRREMPSGTIITLDGISSKLGVSNTPVREAFQILTREGLIRQLPNRCMEVSGITSKTIHDHYETRAVLESAAAASVCKNMAGLSEIEGAYTGAEEALKAGDSASYSNYNQAFHIAIWTAAGNDKMKALLSEMWNGLSMGHKVTEEEYARISIGEHEGILAALRRRDAELARNLMNDHIVRSMENVLTNFDAGPG